MLSTNLLYPFIVMTIEYTTGLALITLSFDPQQDSILHVLFVLCAGQICNISSFTVSPLNGQTCISRWAKRVSQITSLPDWTTLTGKKDSFYYWQIQLYHHGQIDGSHYTLIVLLSTKYIKELQERFAKNHFFSLYTTIGIHERQGRFG